ncbi:interleukin-1 receptor-like 1 [Rhinichthys klamathensis goyatoka]|uniref:interleukin-1 receptor-like 1 n=1 Tax=Rhinichthys klamathensis goyatoka TaxID=3034132 RepID=UPI0024B623A2|nr:interleukin-1 receptor-like 1 [Rhinichthys klamathensis goyatoka]
MMMMMMMILLLTESVLVSYQSNSTVQCELMGNRKSVRVRAGESLYFPCPNAVCYEDTEGTSYDWLKNLSRTNQIERIGTEESERVHYHQSALYILWLTPDDTGRYITRWWYEKDKCDEYETDIVVYEEFHTDLLYFTPPEEKASAIYCPVCEKQQAAFIWYKNFSLIPNQESKNVLRIRNSSKESKGIYTCVCTWEHNGLKHNTSGHRRLIIKDQSANNPPVFQLPVNNSIVITDVGTELILVCSVVFVCDGCPVRWERNETTLSEEDGYKQENRIKDGSVQLFLNITKVSELDLLSEFRCTTEDSYRVMFVSITLKSRASMLAVILACICTFLLVLVLSVIVKWFSLDLVLFLREISIKFNRKEDGKLYDAYVIYQRNNSDETTSKTVSDFVNGSLLTVLESYCGFKLFIHGRDDLPGEDCMNLIETKIQLSRRLIIILTPGTSSISPEAYDLQVGLHQALVQGETGVILIQLGEMQDYTHLPLGLQHLLCKNNPLLWRDGQSSPTSKFWKRVRYRMPVASSRQRSSEKRSLECPSLPV